MANASSFCPAPFMDAGQFNHTRGGYHQGRFCGSMGEGTCCLPCPLYQYLFSDRFLATSKHLQYTSPFSLATCVFLLLSWLCLPPNMSHRHYLSVGLITSVLLIDIGLALPLIRPIHECADAITPANGISDPVCGLTGAFFFTGALGVVVWIFMRVIWLHISVCWNRTPGQTIMYISIASGIAIPLIFLGATIGYSGFTYEIGPTCFIYQEHSFVVFWGWMIGFTIAAFVLQIITSGYCVTLYFMTHRLRIGSSASAKSSSTFGSLRYWTVRKKKRESEAEAYERAIRIFNQRRNRWKGIHRVLLLQWRIILLTVALVIQCLYFGSLSWAEDTKTASAPTNPKALAFGECLFLTDGNANKCMQYADALVLDKAAMLAGMGVMALSGVQAGIFMFHRSILTGWWKLLKNPRRLYQRRTPASTARNSMLSDPPPSRSHHQPVSSSHLHDSSGLTFPFRMPAFSTRLSNRFSARLSDRFSTRFSLTRPSPLAPLPLAPRRPSSALIHEAGNSSSRSSGAAAAAGGGGAGGGGGGRIVPKDFVSLDEHGAQPTIESTLLALKKMQAGWVPERPPRPESLFREPDTSDASSWAPPPPPPIPEHLSRSGIACVEQLPVWVRMMGPLDGPVLRLADAPRGGLGSHPIDMHDLRQSPRGQMAVGEMEESEVIVRKETG